MIEKYLQEIYEQMEFMNGLWYNLLGMMNLDNGIPQTQVLDTPCTEGETDMAKRIKQRVNIGGEQQWVTGNTLADVLEKAITKTAEVISAKTDTKVKDTPDFGSFFDKYKSTFWRSLRQNTIEAYTHSARNYILPRFESVPIGEIEVADIQMLYDDMNEAGKSNETIKKVRNVMSPAMDYAVEEGIIPKNPFASKRLTIRGRESIPHKALKADEMRRIRETLPTLPDDQRRLLALMCYTGERIGEVLGFSWEDIDVENGVLNIVHGVTHPKRNRAIVGPPKTDNGLRSIPLTKGLLDTLQPMKKQGFILGGDRPLTFTAYRNLQKKAFMAADITGYTSHDFRDTCATEWMEAGIPLKVISQMLGHADVNVTARRYTKVRENSLASAAAAMNAYHQAQATL